MLYWPDGKILEDERRLEVTENDKGFEFHIGSVWVNVYFHEPPQEGWWEEHESGYAYVRYYPEFSILVCQ